ncbi:C39 family peptidase [Mangrovitalea sediminis]|uniref:C39 family peptidase n=1 Tax=Mangrovitalea sediminis TaxID=1982043 RepID=UPI0018E950CC|nr:C39 family peptidase [Mangrovitalea sediminis]
MGPKTLKRYAPLLMVVTALYSTPSPAGDVNLVAPGFGQFRAPVTSLQELRFKTTIHQQYDYSCGSAAVATLLTYQFHDPVSESQVFQAMWKLGNQEAIRREGFSMWDMKTYLESRGYTANGYEVPLERLITAGLPAIALITENGYAHFVVIKGLDSQDVVLGDPARGTRIMTRAAFEASWHVRILLAVTNHGDQAIFNNVADWRIRPEAPLSQAVANNNMLNATLLLSRPGDF